MKPKNHGKAKGLFAGIAVSLAMLPLPGHAEYPDRSVRIVVPFTPGGAADIAARAVGQRLASRFGQPFVVVNKPGAGGAVAAEYVARSVPDGYTLFVADMGILAINPALKSALSYRAADFRPISSLARVPQFLAVNVDLPVKTLSELIAYAKAHPGLTYGTPGVGTSHHLEMEAFNAGANLKLRHVPYKGGAQTIPAVISGEIGMTVSALGALRPQVAAGRIRLLGVTSAERSPLAPEVASIADVLGKYDFSDAVGLLAPVGTREEIIQRLNTAIVEEAREPAFIQRLADLGLEVRVGTPASYAHMISEASNVFGAVVRSLDLKAE